MDILLQVMDKERALPRQVQLGIDRDLETVVLKCQAKDALRCNSSTEALADELEGWLHGSRSRLGRRESWKKRGSRRGANRLNLPRPGSAGTASSPSTTGNRCLVSVCRRARCSTHYSKLCAFGKTAWPILTASGKIVDETGPDREVVNRRRRQKTTEGEKCRPVR
jgi:hypothetical protein